MRNRNIQTAWKYHDDTKHYYCSIRNHPHFLDWANRPQPFKIYPNIEPLPLPREVPQTGVAALSAISEPLPSLRADSVPDLQDLARILYFSAGIATTSSKIRENDSTLAGSTIVRLVHIAVANANRAMYGLDDGRMAQVPLLSTLLDPVQLLVEPHRHEHHQEYRRPDAEHAHRDG